MSFLASFTSRIYIRARTSWSYRHLHLHASDRLLQPSITGAIGDFAKDIMWYSLLNIRNRNVTGGSSRSRGSCIDKLRIVCFYWALRIRMARSALAHIAFRWQDTDIWLFGLFDLKSDLLSETQSVPLIMPSRALRGGSFIENSSLILRDLPIVDTPPPASDSSTDSLSLEFSIGVPMPPAGNDESPCHALNQRH